MTEVSDDDGVQYLVDVCEALVRTIRTGAHVSLSSERNGDELTVSFKVPDADDFHAMHRLVAVSHEQRRQMGTQ